MSFMDAMQEELCQHPRSLHMEVSRLAGRGGVVRATTGRGKHLHGQSAGGTQQAGGFGSSAVTVCHGKGLSGEGRSHSELQAPFGNGRRGPDLSESTCAARSMPRTGSQTGKRVKHSPDRGR